MLSRTLQLYQNSFRGLSREVWLLSAVLFINRSGTMVIPFLTVYLTQQLGFTKLEAGAVMTCFGIGSVAGSYFGGFLTDKIGHYRIQFWSLFLSGWMFMLLLFVKDFYSICITIFLVSVVAESFRPASMTALTAYSSTENRTRSITLIRLAINLGIAMGPAIGGLMAATIGYDGLFILDGLTCVFASLFLWRFLENKKAPPKEQNSEENVKNGELQANTPQSPYKDKIYLVFLVFVLINAVAFMQLLSTMPVFFKEHFLLNEDAIGLLLALNGFLIFVFEMPLIYLVEKRFNQLFLVAIGALLVGLCYFLFNLFPMWAGVAVVGMISLTFGEMLNFPFSNTYAMSRATDQNMGQYMGLYTMTFSIGFMFAPLLGMYLSEAYGWATMWYVMGGLNLVAFFGYLMMQKAVST